MGKVQGYTLPAYPGGINLVDQIDRIPETDAIDLLNVYPTGSRLELRKGIESSWTADNGACSTLANLVLADSSEKLVSACNNGLFVQNGASSTDVTGTTTPTNDEWQHVVFNNRLFLVNGEDNGQVYTGSGTFSDISFTGISTSSLTNVTSHNERLYFIEKDTGSFWYGNLKAIGSSALTEVDISYFLKLGGSLISCGSWTDNIGDSSKDLFWLLSSEGELLLYQGSFPGSIEWGLVARYVIGKPLGYRSHIHIDDDVWFLTSQGIVPLSTLFQAPASIAADTISRKINKTLRDSAAQFPFSSLYSAKYYQLERKLIVNYPTTGTSTRQLVCNLETGAWTKYKYAITGAVQSIEIHNNKPYYGAASGKVFEGETGFSDDGNSIQFRINGGFNFFGTRGQYKVFKDVRPIIKTSAGSLTLRLDVDTDFRTSLDYATVTIPDLGDNSVSAWDLSSFDSAQWADEERYLFERYSLGGQGHCGALRISGSMIDALLEFNAFEIRFEQGGQT